MSGAAYSLGRRLVTRIVMANGLVLAANVPYFLWRAYVKHAAEGRVEAAGNWLLHEIATDVVPLMLPLFVATLLVAVVTVRRCLAPVAAMSRQAAAFDPSHLDVRLPLDAVPRELVPLIDAVNAGLGRIAEGFASQKRFTADAAHELRTPLALLRARCSGRDCPQSRTLAADIDRMSRIVDQMLAMARLEMRQIPLTQPVDLDAVCQRVIADLFPLALGAGRDLGFSSLGAATLARGNDLVLENALRNLVENGLRLTPAGEAVEVVLEPHGVIRVLDRGPGVPDDCKADIFRPFRRVGNSRHGGAGLGLAIAAEAVDLHGGTISVKDRPGGGAEFVIDLSRSVDLSG